MSDSTFNSRNIKENDFSANAEASVKLKFLLEYAILAPSSHNTRPWIFKIVDDAMSYMQTKSAPYLLPTLIIAS